MKRIVKPHVALAVMAAAFGSVVTAQAANFPERVHLDKQSRERGLGVASVSLIRREPGPGAEQRASAVLSILRDSRSLVHARGQFKQRLDPQSKTVTLNGIEGWSLKVWADGTKVRYQNHAAVEKATATGVPLDKRLASDDLRARGERFIRTTLPGVITLSGDDELVPSFSEYEINTMEDEVGTVLEKSVASATVVFSRRVGGITVLGRGSKIAVTFNNDGDAIAFDLDWPEYSRSTKAQTVLPLAEIVERASALGHTSADPETVALKRFECGYFDLGARVEKPRSLLQSACVATYVGRTLIGEAANPKNSEDGWGIAADVNVIPAGLQVEKDENWPEAQAIAGGIELPKSSGVSKALSRERWQP